MNTPNLPAVIEDRAPAVPDLGVGSRVRVNNPDFPHLHGVLGLVTEHRPQRVISHLGFFPFTALEDFGVALVQEDGLVLVVMLSRDELEVLA